VKKLRRRVKLMATWLAMMSPLWVFIAARGGAAQTQSVLASCSVCHRPDERGRLSRIAAQRKTPEGWQTTVRRMVRLHSLSMSVDEAKAVVKYLSDHQGLAPAEVQPIAYVLERRDIRERVPNQAVRVACVRCHSFARIAAQRRTPEEWRKLKTLHLAVFPTLVYQMRQVDWPALADEAIEYLAKSFPFDREVWQRWRGDADIEGQWPMAGHQAGRGDFFGDVEIKRVGTGQFTTRERLVFTDGQRIERTGNGLLYAGFAWRGSAESSDGQPIKEVWHLSEDGKMFTGRWFVADRDQIGADVSLHRQTGAPLVLGLNPRSLRAPTAHRQVKIYGANFPPSLTANEVELGPGVIIHRLEGPDGDELMLTLDVQENALPGPRDVRVGNAVGKAALTIYKRIDYIKVQPELGLARVGGVKVPKQHQQFEALAFDNGADGISGTADDLALGPVEASWSIERYASDPTDDDVKFVGTIDQHGLFTPADEGPNPARRKGDDNVGEVWVVASYKPEDATGALTARAKLIVTVPRFIDWEIR